MSTIQVNDDGANVQVIFEMGEDPHIFRDALYFTSEQYATLTEAEIEAMKQERYDAWIAHINTPADPQLAQGAPVVPEETPVGGEYIEINGVKYIKADI